MAQCLANIDFMLKINIQLMQQCVCISKCQHILLHYISLKPLLKMIHGLIHWAIADRLDEIYGGEGEFDKYFDSHIEQIQEAYKSIEQIC